MSRQLVLTIIDKVCYIMKSELPLQLYESVLTLVSYCISFHTRSLYTKKLGNNRIENTMGSTSTSFTFISTKVSFYTRYDICTTLYYIIYSYFTKNFIGKYSVKY